MTAQAKFKDWLVERFGSLAAVDEQFDEFTPAGARLHREWMLSVCEDAGIPYSGWTADSLRCARQRLTIRDSEIDSVQALNSMHNRATKSALDHWLHHLAGFPSAYS